MKQRVISIGLLLAMLLSLASPLSAMAADVSENPLAVDEVTTTTESEETEKLDVMAEEPGNTQDPMETELPDTPDIPDTPEETEIPEESDVPETPEKTEIPEEPDVPETPGDVPAVEEKDSDLEISESPKWYAESEEKEIQTITDVEDIYSVVCGDKAITLQPKTSGNGAITFTSSNSDVVSVGKTTGKMTFRNAGTAIITIIAGETENYGEARRTVTITVTRAKQAISGVKEEYKAVFGDKAIILQPKTSGNGAITFASSNTNVASVGKTSGKVIFRSAGAAVITITAGKTSTFNTAKRTVKITVTRAKQVISGVSAKYSKVYKPGGTFTLRAKSSADGIISYQSSDTKVVAVNKITGKVALKGAGTASIIVTASKTNNYQRAQKTIQVTVNKASQTVKGVANRYEKNYETQKSFQLKAKTTGDGAVTYKSSDPVIAAVGKTSGKVTLKKRGACTITVTASATGNYKKATKKVKLILYKKAKTLRRSKYYKKSKYCKRLNALKLTDTNRRNILEIARSQLGYHEGNKPSQMDGSNKNGSGNYTEFGNYYGIQGAWCAMFVNWCARENAVSTYKIPSTCRVMDYYSFYHKRGQRYYSWPKTKGGKKGTYTPKAGDLILYSTRLGGPTHHIGYVSGCTVKEKTIVIKTLEGNTSNEAREKVWTLKRGSSGYVSSFGQYINGFASPRY